VRDGQHCPVRFLQKWMSEQMAEIRKSAEEYATSLRDNKK
jgi:hypothetical protein